MIGRTNSTFGGSISLPDGSTATANDVQTWLKCAGINKSYTSVSQVVADTDTMFLLMSDENAMKYLARSTDFADTICADETSMTYLGQSAYVDSTILNSDLWVTKIRASQYWDKIYTQQFIIHAGAYETVTIDGYGGSFTTNADGTVTHALPLGTIILKGSVSGQSFTRTVTNSTTKVYVMPEGALYWYGNECTDVTGGFGETYNFNNKNICTKEINRIKVLGYGDSSSGAYEHLSTANKINISNYSKLKADIAFGEITDSRILNIATINNDLIFDNASCIIKSGETKEKCELDIGDISGTYYPILYLKTNSPNGTTSYINAFWLE